MFVDGGGVGGGVEDRLRQLGVPVIDVQFGSKSDRLALDEARYANKRSEIWGSLREWLKVGALPPHDELREELIGPIIEATERGRVGAGRPGPADTAGAAQATILVLAVDDVEQSLAIVELAQGHLDRKSVV